MVFASTTEHVTIFGKLAKQIQSFCSTNKVIAIRINETFNETFIFWCLLKNNNENVLVNIAAKNNYGTKLHKFINVLNIASLVIILI